MNILNSGILFLKKEIEDKINILGDNNYKFRYSYIAEYGFCIVTEELVNSLAQELTKEYYDVGCGAAYLSSILYKMEKSPICIDMVKWSNAPYSVRNKEIKKEENEIYKEIIKEEQEAWHPVLYSDAIKWLEKNNNTFNDILLLWPDYNCDFAFKIAKQIQPKQRLFYLGEEEGGCTANTKFFKYIKKMFREENTVSKKLNMNHLQFPGIHDTWSVYKKE